MNIAAPLVSAIHLLCLLDLQVDCQTASRGDYSLIFALPAAMERPTNYSRPMLQQDCQSIHPLSSRRRDPSRR